MTEQCSLTCGNFTGIDRSRFKAQEAYLKDIFHFLEFDKENNELQICGGRHIRHDPEQLKEIFNILASILESQGKGSIMLTCEQSEICYFRQNMWKLVPVYIPDDPFEDIYYVR